MPTDPNQVGRSLNLDRFPRTTLCHQPTPIEPLPRLSAHLGGPDLYIKRDDCTGLATGGNKTRKLEFLVGEALHLGADMLVTQGAVQSNHVRQTAAAACRTGLSCHALLERRVPDQPADYEGTGNVLLDQLFGMSYEFRPGGLDMNAETESVTDKLRQQGRNPYFIPGGGSNETGALGYSACAEELLDQSRERQIRFDHLVMATGSTGTQAGLAAGLFALDADLPVTGVSVRQPRDKQTAAVLTLANLTLDKLDRPRMPESVIKVEDGYVGQGYGIPADSTLEAISLLATLEGILLDPVYSGKGMAGLIGLVRAGNFKPGQRVLFLHTGGSAALFAYRQQITAYIGTAG